MKPNIDQEKLIDQILRKTLKFKDTYDEVYDHILSALDALPDDAHFVDALYDIIANDFGGAKGLRAIERKHTRFAIRQFMAEYLKALVKPLTSAAILLLVPGIGLVYFLIASGWQNGQSVQLLISSISIAILGIAVFKFRQQVRSLRAGQQVVMGSIRQNIIAFSGGFLLFLPFFLCNSTTLVCHKLNYNQVPPAVYTIAFFIVALHTFAAYKMYTTLTS